MALDIVTVPCLNDNYAYLVKAPDGVCIIDAPEAAPIIAAAEARGWEPGVLMITHHHHDHVGGLDALKSRFGLMTMGPAAEKARLPPLDHYLNPGDTGGDGPAHTIAMEVGGHTLGHMAFHFDQAGAVFTADSLMAFGCGRVFEGTYDQMFDSLRKLAALPPDTMVYSGHEYTAANAKFALTIEPQNEALISRVEAVKAARAANRPTAQVRLSEELDTNPFLRSHVPQVAENLGMQGVSPAEVFAEIRRRKDAF
nr:hydroxyacylglutathione hydrolase [Pseudooceanicola aestuarii]